MRPVLPKLFLFMYNVFFFQVIKVQLYQNIALAFVCISATTALLMSNLYASVQVGMGPR